MHKLPSFLEYIASKSEYVFLPEYLSPALVHLSLTELLYNHASLADEQLYLLVTVLLSLSQVPMARSSHPTERLLHQLFVQHRGVAHGLRLLHRAL